MKNHIQNYAIGILLVIFSIYAVLLFSYPVANYFTGEKDLNYTSFLLSRLFIWSILPIFFLYAKFVEKDKILIKKEQNYSLVRFTITAIVLLIITAFLSGILNFLIIHIFHEKTSPKLNEISNLLKNNFWLLFFVCNSGRNRRNYFQRIHPGEVTKNL